MIDEYDFVINAEVDLKKEAGNTIQTANFLKTTNFYTFQNLSEFSGSKVLTLERVEGIPVTDLNKLKNKKVNLKIIGKGVSIFFKQLFEDNFFHADMHPGNILLSTSDPESPTYVAVDYAICGSLSLKGTVTDRKDALRYV